MTNDKTKYLLCSNPGLDLIWFYQNDQLQTSDDWCPVLTLALYAMHGCSWTVIHGDMQLDNTVGFDAEEKLQC